MRRLVIRPGGIGDVIVSLPAIACLETEDFEVWLPARMVSLFALAPVAGRVRAISSTGLDLVGVVEPPAVLMEALRQFDSIVSWYGANRPEFREAVAALGLPVTFLPALPPEDSRVHATDFYLSQVRANGECQSDGIPRLVCPVTPCPVTPCERFAVIHPFSGSARKNWPLANFQAMARELEGEMLVRWLAGGEDPPLPGALHIPDLRELACFLAGAALYVGNDSGISHLAAAAGAPVLALFGPTDPAVWAPRGANVRVGRWQAEGNSV